MAKNISKNQWFKDIIDDVYLNTTVINDMLIVSISSIYAIQNDTVIAKARNPSLFNFIGKDILGAGGLALKKDGQLRTTQLANMNRSFIIAPLKTKQLETDFYSPEQLAEMYPDDPAYHVATPGLMDYDITDNVKSESTIEPPVSGTDTTITSEVSNNDEPS